MKLSEAYSQWQRQQACRPLYMRTREAFRKVWFDLPTNKETGYYTLDVLGAALAATDAAVPDKINAASVMVHVLAYANTVDPDHSPLPDFNYNAVLAASRTPSSPPLPSGNTKADAGETTTVVLPDSAVTAGEETSPSPAPSSPAVRRGRAPKPYAQIDPVTFEIVKVWPTMAEAERATGADNLWRCATKFTQSAGFFWSEAADAGTFRQRLEEHNKGARRRRSVKTGQPAKRKSAAAPAVKEPVVKDAVPVASPQEPEGPVFMPASEAAVHKVTPDLTRGTFTTGGATAASRALAVFSDDELLEELDRRGFEGNLRKTYIYTLGK